MESRVGTLKIHLRVPAELAASGTHLQHQIERDLMVRVLEELERLLHARLGTDAVIRVRRLSLKWQLDARELVTEDLIRRLALDLSTGLLADVARQSLSGLVRPRSESIAVFQDEAHATAAALADLADAAPTSWVHGPMTAPEVWERAAREPSSLPRVIQWLVRMERLAPAIALAPETVLGMLVERVADAAPIVALIRARRDAATAPPQTTATPLATAGTLRAEPLDLLRAPTDVEAASAGAAPLPRPETPVPDLEISGDRDESPRITAGASPPARALADDAIAVSAPLREGATAHAGLFYLVGRVLEIDLAEHLWAAGLREGPVLAHVAAALVGDVEDPAWRWFGGSFDARPTLPAIASWATAEVIERTQHSLGRRLLRFGLSLTSSSLAAQLDRLADALHPMDDLEPTAARLVTRSAAAIAAIACARLGTPASIAALREVCARPGRLVLTPSAVHAVISIAYASIEHRRAGLDQDPGHVPWLKRKLYIELAGAPEL